MTTAYSYKRFSSEKQARGDSLRRQTELAENYIKDNPHLNLELDTTKDLTDSGLSAYKGTHLRKGALGVFLRAVEDGQIEEGSYLLVESIDRLYRSEPAEALPMLIDLVNYGVVVVTLNDEKVFSKKTLQGVEGTFVIMQSLVSMARAYEESATKGKRVKAAWDNKFQKIADGIQLTKRVPFWLAEDRQVIPEKAAVVQRIYQMYSDGIGTYNIARILNNEKVSPPTSRADHWAISTVTKVLRSKNTIGILVTANGIEHENYYPSVIDQHLWLECQKLKKTSKNATGRNSTAVLSGLCKCVECGGTARKATKTGRIKKDGTRGRWETLVCSRAMNNAGCPYIGISYKKIIDCILTQIRNLEFYSPADDHLKKITHLGNWIVEFESEVNEAYYWSKKLKTLDSREKYLQLAKSLEEAREELRQLKTQPGSFSLESQKRVLDDIFIRSKVTNSNLRKVIKEIQVDFRKKELTMLTHLDHVITAEIEIWLGDAL